MCVCGGGVSSMFHQHIETCNIVSKQCCIVSKQVGGNYFVKNASIVRAWVLRVNMCLCLFMCLGVGVYVRVFVCAFVRL